MDIHVIEYNTCFDVTYNVFSFGNVTKGGFKMSVYDVAKYVLHKQGALTTLKLQKLVYYCQAWSLAWDGVPLFDEEFEAWANGPVCPQLFGRHRGLFVVDESLFNDRSDRVFSQNQLDTMNSVLEAYGDKESHWLSELTHKEAPWKDARKGIAQGEPSNEVITKEAMQEYYSGLI